ncbi:hypothetical protein EYC80_000513 [Monilinia laxa]|uniref:Uncharacterized protein n=1 Tax=Monilinia laxa TaxID=61186 RepID=A0A5N6KAX2_MONLA|nr:hypothetical protein EYC80_000513 [Monilinia laxa]
MSGPPYPGSHQVISSASCRKQGIVNTSHCKLVFQCSYSQPLSIYPILISTAKAPHKLRPPKICNPQSIFPVI